VIRAHFVEETKDSSNAERIREMDDFWESDDAERSAFHADISKKRLHRATALRP